MRPAHTAVRKAIRRGELPPAKDCVCVDCGKRAECYDHRDYLKPLNVDPVCKTCDNHRGPGANRGDELSNVDNTSPGGKLKADPAPWQNTSSEVKTEAS